MRIYVLTNKQAAKDCRQLLALKSDSLSLEYSKSLRSIPTNVLESLALLEEFVDSKVADLCSNNAAEIAIDNSEEQEIFQAIKTNGIIKTTLGSGVVLENEVPELMDAISNYHLLSLKKALEIGKNIVVI